MYACQDNIVSAITQKLDRCNAIKDPIRDFFETMEVARLFDFAACMQLLSFQSCRCNSGCPFIVVYLTKTDALSWHPNFVDQRTMEVGCELKAVDNKADK